MGDAKARTEAELAKVQDSLAATEEAKRKAKVEAKVEAEASHVEVERTSLLLEIGVTKEEVASL